MDKFQAIRIFLQIVESGSFSKAADELDVSSTSASRQLQELEDQIGVRLLHRSTRSLSLTDAGETLHAHYAKMLAELGALERQLALASTQVQGKLRVALPNTFATQYMKTILRDYQAAHPAVMLDVALDDNRVDLVKERVDVALRIALALEPSVVARRLTTIRLAICASPAYLAARGTPNTPGDLLAHSCLLYTANNPADEWHFDGPGGHVAQRVRGAKRANNGEILRDYALAGDGIVVQPTFLVGADLKSGALVRVLDGYEPSPLGAYAVYLDRDHLPATVRSFIDFLGERISDPPWWDLDG